MKPNTKAALFVTAVTVMLLLSANVGFVSAVFADTAVITNSSVATDSLQKADVKKIFLGQKTKWDDGQAIKFVIMEKSDVHKEFIKTFTGKSTSQFKNYWKKQVFTGKGSFPLSLNTEKELIDFVASTEGAVGYISTASVKAGVKKIAITD